MNPFKLSLALSVPLALASVAAPATAAPDMHRTQDYTASAHYAGFGQATNLRKDIKQLDRQIDRALATHRISYREATGLRRNVDQVERLFAQYARGGLTRYEARTLESRIDQVQKQIAREIHDDNGRSRAWNHR